MNNRYAVIENGVLVNVVVATPEFAQSQGWISCPNYNDQNQAIGPGFTYQNGQFIAPPPRVPTAEENKAKALALLASTDWVNQPDVYDPNVNPHLENRSEFITYRSQVREIAINPQPGNLNWPVEPTPIWS